MTSKPQLQQLQRSNQVNTFVSPTAIHERMIANESQSLQVQYGARVPQTIAAAGTAITLMTSVTYVTALAASYAATLPDPTIANTDSYELVGLMKTVVMPVAPGAGFTVTVTPVNGPAVTLSSEGSGVTYIWTPEGWCVVNAGGSGPGGVVTLADTLHATATVAIGQEPTTAPMHPQPTAIEGLSLTLNLDTDAADVEVFRPSVAGDRGLIGLTGVSSTTGDGAGINIRTGGSTFAAAISGSLDLRTGVSAAGDSGDIGIETGDTQFASGNTGGVSITTGSRSLNAAAPGISTGRIRIETGTTIGVGGDTGDVLVRSGYATNGESGVIEIGSGNATGVGFTSGSVALFSGQSSSDASGNAVVQTGEAGPAATPGYASLRTPPRPFDGTRSGHIWLQAGNNSRNVAPNQLAGAEVVLGSASNDTGGFGRHIVVQQETLPTLSLGVCDAGSSDTVGRFTVPAASSVTLTFINLYGAAPFVLISPELAAGAQPPFVAARTTGGFTVTNDDAGEATPVTYMVIGSTPNA